MPQGVLPFQFEVDKSEKKLTALAGLLLYLDLMLALGFRASIRRHVRATGEQGWSDEQLITAITLLSLAGGDVVEDLDTLERDRGLGEVVQLMETHHLSRRQLDARGRRFRKGASRVFPSASPTRRYLEKFHDEAQEQSRPEKGAFIPKPNEHLDGLDHVNTDMVKAAQKCMPSRIATLDMDATLSEVHKQSAKYCYKHFPAYQPLNTWWAEQELIVHSEFRDGNVPAGYEQLRVLEHSLAVLPEGVEEALLRSDTAGYQWDLLKYCAEGTNERFGVIKFAVGCNVTKEFKKAVAEVPERDWHPLLQDRGGILVDTGQQWAEVCYVPSEIGKSKKGPTYRFLAIREPLAEQTELPGLDSSQKELPFPTMNFGVQKKRFKLFGVVTNFLEKPGEEIITWLRKRCGKSEEVHDIMKSDLTGGRFPSDKFGANAAWWAMMILALNLNTILKRLALGGRWVKRRLKAIRFGVIQVAARIIRTGRRIVIKLSCNTATSSLLLEARRRILAAGKAPPVK